MELRGAAEQDSQRRTGSCVAAELAPAAALGTAAHGGRAARARGSRRPRDRRMIFLVFLELKI